MKRAARFLFSACACPFVGAALVLAIGFAITLALVDDDVGSTY